MAENSKIEWCHHTFNPWIGCTKVSAGCDNCYAEAMMDRRLGRARWGHGQPRQRTSPANWRKPIHWNMWAESRGERHRVFCASLADVFDSEVPLEWRGDLFDLIRRTPHLDWLLLSKRPDYAYRHWQNAWKSGHHWPRNIWIGTTVESQEVDSRIDSLLRINDGRVTFLSCEPLIGRVDLCEVLGIWWNQTMGVFESCGPRMNPRGLGWVICGGESGPGARPMREEWARSLRDTCRAAGVPFFMKQMARKGPIPDDLMVREYPK